MLFKSIQIRSLIKKIRPDLLHVHSFTHYALLGFLSGFHPLVITAWGSDILVSPRENLSHRITVKLAIKKADLLTCDAEHIKKPMIDLGARDERIKLVCFGIDTRKFQPQPQNAGVREKLGVFDNPMVISLRSLRPIYDLESLLRAVPPVLKDHPGARFVIAGEGPQKNQLVELARSLGISASVHFIGNIPNHELPRYLTASDIYVSTSLSDAGLSASTAEAMACGLPVIITDFGDNRLWVQDGANGYLIPLKSPEALASRIIDLINHPERRRDFGNRGRQVIMEKNDLYREMGKMELLYQELIEKRS